MTKRNVNARDRKLLDLWESKLSDLFGGAIPAKKEWTDSEEVARVLKAMRGEDTYFFQPGDGGLEMLDSRATSDGLVEWTDETSSLDEFAFVVRPVRLVFWNPGNQTHEANFILEVDAQAPGCPTGEMTNHVGIEQCMELAKGSYAPLSAGHERAYFGKSFPAAARVVRRATRPARFALFSKGSLYYRYDGHKALHNDHVQFEDLVSQFAAIEIT